MRLPLKKVYFYQCQRNHGDEEGEHLPAWFPELEIDDEKQAHSEDAYMQLRQETVAQQWSEGTEQGQDDGDGRDGQALIVLARLICLVLPVLFHHIEKCQADDACREVKDQDTDAGNSLHPDGIAQYHRKSTKADHIAEGVYLDTEPLFIFRAVGFGAGHFAVKHVAEAGKGQTEQGVPGMTLEGEHDAQSGGCQPHIC